MPSKVGGSKKGQKSSKKLVADKDIILKIDASKLPKEARFNGYEDYYVQDLIIKKEVICYKRARYILPDGRSILAPLPNNVQDSFGNTLKTFIAHQYHVARTPKNKIKELLEDLGIAISEGQIHNILMELADKLKKESELILKEGLKSDQIRTDDTGARHKKMNYYTTVIQNKFFAYFKTESSKSRKNFLRILQGSNIKYVFNEAAYNYMHELGIKSEVISKLFIHKDIEFASLNEFEKVLSVLGIDKYTTGQNVLKTIEEAALLGGVFSIGVNLNAVLMSDNAPQFKKIFATHALCWVHMIRSISKIVPATEKESKEINWVLDSIWAFYKKLKTYQDKPNIEQNNGLIEEFDQIFGQTVESQSLLESLYTFKKYKKALLCVLEHPKTPLHNNSSESDIRPAVIKRKISGPTRSEQGRIARDSGLTVTKTSRKLGISPWKYLNDSISNNPEISQLSKIVAERVAAEKPPIQVF
jgi:hypothetical protein